MHCSPLTQRTYSSDAATSQSPHWPWRHRSQSRHIVRSSLRVACYMFQFFMPCVACFMLQVARKYVARRTFECCCRHCCATVQRLSGFDWPRPPGVSHSSLSRECEYPPSTRFCSTTRSRCEPLTVAKQSCGHGCIQHEKETSTLPIPRAAGCTWAACTSPSCCTASSSAGTPPWTTRVRPLRQQRQQRTAAL